MKSKVAVACLSAGMLGGIQRNAVGRSGEGVFARSIRRLSGHRVAIAFVVIGEVKCSFLLMVLLAMPLSSLKTLRRVKMLHETCTGRKKDV